MGAGERLYSGLGTLVELLRRRALSQAEVIGYIFLSQQDEEVTPLAYGELDRQARAIAAVMQSLGLAGERALLLYPPGLGFHAGFFGCLYAGVVAVPAYPPRVDRALPRLRAIARDAEVGAVLGTSAVLSGLEPFLDQLPELNSVPRIDTTALDLSLAIDWKEISPAAASLAFLQYTSGSTGSPKGVMLAHEDLLHNASLIYGALNHDAHDKYVSWLPTYHDMGFMSGVLEPLYAGVCAVLLSPVSFLQSPFGWLKAISDHRGTTSGAPNFAYDLCVRKTSPEQRASIDLSSWATAFNGAEPVRAETINRFCDAFKPSGFRRDAFYPCYGLAEATLIVSGGSRLSGPSIRAFDAEAMERNRVEEAAEGSNARRLVACGEVLGAHEVVIVDPELETPCGGEQIGEIWVSGPSVARGYWNKPTLSDQTFRARLRSGRNCPFLRTGDLGFVKDNLLFVTGRLKDLIIVRGLNHYPQDIELTVERSHPGLRPGCGAAFGIEVNGEERLVVVHELDKTSGAVPEVVVGRIREEVAAEHELEVYAISLIEPGTIAKTSSGKIQRHACRSSFLSGDFPRVYESAPESPLLPDARTEEMIAKVFRTQIATGRAGRLDLAESFLREILATGLRRSSAQIDSDAPLASLGMDSLASIEFQTELERLLGVRISASAIIGGATLRELATEVLVALDTACPKLEVSGNIVEETTFPLSHGQRALWFLHRLAPESGAYNVGGAARIKTPVEPQALQRAMQEVVDRHSALRTTFLDVSGEPAQRIHENPSISFEVVEASGWSDSALRGSVSEVIERPFDLSAGPPIRAVFFARSGRDPVLALSLHHLVADLWSLAIIMEELGALYEKQVSGSTAVLPPVERGYWAFVKAEAEMLAGSRGEELWSYWRDELSARARVLELPTDRPRPPIQTYSGARVMGTLTGPDTEAVKKLAVSSGVTCFTASISAFHVLLYRYCGAEDILVGTPASLRETGEMAQVVGYLVNPVVIRVETRGDVPFARVLETVRSKVAAAHKHRQYPFRLIVDRLQSERDPALAPIFQVFFSFQSMRIRRLEQLGAFAVGKEGARATFGGLEVEVFGFERRTVQFDLSLEVADVDEKMVVSLAYNSDFFDRQTAERLLGHYLEVLCQTAKHPSHRLADIPLLSEAEEHQIIVEWNNVESPLTLPHETTCVGRLLSMQTARLPDAVAVVSSDSHLTYDGLERSVKKLANHIRRLGGRPESPVGLLLRRSANMLVCLLGALRSGAAYVPLDPAFPTDRLQFMVADAGIELLISDDEPVCAALRYGGRTVCLDQQLSAIRDESELFEGEPLLDSLAYIIYTSGSTGRPKGVMVTHRNLANFLLSMKECLCLSPTDVLLAATTLSFDIAVLELLLPVIVGARIVVASHEDAHDPNRLRDELGSQRVTVMQATPTAWRQIVALPPINGRLKVLSGGEALPRQLADEMLRWADEVVNLYGPTETTVWSTLSSEVDGPSIQSHLSIGRPIHNTEVRVLGQFFEQLPIGARGSIYIAGEGVSRGYFGRADLTADRFRPDQFGSRPGSRIYDTGDIGRIAPDGNIECLGRSDFQTKVRGHRIELEEIEAVLRSHPMVADAVAATRQVSPGETRLLAYVVCKDGYSPPAAMLRSHLKQKLPEYMLPAFYIALDSIPLTANGKVDRRALPGPGMERPELGSAYSGPCTPLQEALAAIWSDVLGLERVGINDNFFELGGDSILAIKVVSRANKANIPITPANMFQQQTVAGLADMVGTRAVEPVRRPLPASGREAFLELLSEAVRRDIQTVLTADEELEDGYPLSAAQQGMLFHTLHSPNSGVYLEHLIVTLESSLDRPAFRKAWEALVGANAVLRTSIVWEGVTEPLQVVHRSVSLSYAEDDLSGLDPGVRGDRLRSVIEEETQREFDLCQAPLTRLRLIRTGASRWQLVWSYHHILLDGWSLPILVNELLRLYAAHLRGEQVVIEARRPYRDYVAWLANQDASRAELFWREYLAGFNNPTTPALERRVSPTGNERAPFGELNAELSDRSAATLLAATRETRITVNTLLLGLWGVLLGRYSGEPDVLFGETYAGRPFSLEGADSMVGMFINTLPVRIRIEREKPLGSWLRSLQVGLAEVHEYEHSSLAQVQGWSEVAPGTPLFDTIMVVENYPIEKAVFSSWAGLRIESARLIEHTNYPLSIVIVPGPPIQLRVIFDRSRYEEYSVQRFLGHYKGLLDRASELIERTLGEAPILSRQEEHQILHEWNETRRDYSRYPLVHQLLRETGEQCADSVAVSFQSIQLSYRELNRVSSLLASRLASMGVGPEATVGILMERSEWMVVAIIAVLRAGGAFLPLDPTYPVSRISLFLESANARFVILERKSRDLIIDDSILIIAIDAEQPALLSDHQPKAPFPVDEDSLAYVLYTSGSTGEPKGVMITHGCLRNHMLWMREAFPLKHDDVVLQKTPFSFDASIWEFFAPLMAGSRLVVAHPIAHWDAAEIVRAIREEQVTTLQAVPSMLDVISDEPGLAGCSSLRYLFSGGETLTRGLADRLRAQTRASLYNLYGPTEATIDSISEPCEESRHGTTVAVGRPIANTRVYILDDELELQPSGIRGSIWLGGAGIARGYLGAPDLTALKFRPNPFEEEPGERLYCSGDLGRYLADGRVDFLGRADGQIKLHGVRIETEEVESVLEGHGAVRRAVVVAIGDGGQALRLAAYVVFEQGAAIGPEDLKQHLAERLPHPMIPASFVFLENLPLTPHGKLDRKRLQALKVDEPGPSSYQPPRSPVEKVLSGIWEEVLGVQRVGSSDDFFEMGGNSLLAMRLASRVRRAFQADLSIRMLFDARTVGDMAEVLISNESKPGRTLELARLLSMSRVSSRVGAEAQLELPGANRSADRERRTSASESFQVRPDVIERLGELSDSLGASMSAVFLAGWLTLLHRYTERSDLVIGVGVSSREGPEGERSRLERVLPLLASFEGGPGLREVLRRVGRAVDEVICRRNPPPEEAIDQGWPGVEPPAPFQVMFYFVESKADSTPAQSFNTSLIEMNVWTETADLALGIAEEGWGSILYWPEVVDPVAIKRMTGHYLTLLDRFGKDADENVAGVSFLTEAEVEQITLEWNDTVLEQAGIGLVHERFEAVAAAAPDRVAVLRGREQVSYQELNRRANTLASYLRKRGVGAETIVGICLERSVGMVVALLAAIKAGAAYTPLDPGYPSDRLSSMLDQSRPPLVITEMSLIGKLEKQCPETIFLDRIGTDLESEADQKAGVEVCEKNLAYVIYTSGSTGRPKGAMITHEGILNCITTTIEEFGIEPENRVMQFASFSFDVSVWEIFTALLTGSTLCLFPGVGGFSDRDMLEFLRSEGISLAFPLSSVLASLPGEALPALQTLVTGGECFSKELVDRWARGRRFIYVYGPTEAAILQSFVQCTNDYPERPPTIGRPMRNLRFCVTDRNMELVPVGVIGELYIGGVGTGRGYAGSPDLTAEKFVPDPFGEEPGARLYKSGDLAGLRHDGNLDFAGRADGQIKIRGYRVELGEIESVVVRHPLVKQAVIVAREDRPGDKRLVGYVVPADGAKPSSQALRAFAREALPDYMVPASFVMLESVPFTPNGKVDRRALPPPGQDRPDLDVQYEPPADPVQQVLSDIWAAVLDLEKVGIHDDFFDLGGHSLLATQLVSRVRSTFQTDIPFRVLFESRNVAEMARVVVAHESKRGQAEAIARLVKMVETMSAEDVDNALLLIKNSDGSEL